MTNSSKVTVSDEHRHYCPVCTYCQKEPPGDSCIQCSSPKPQKGWPLVQNSPYPYLGRILDGRYILSQFLGDGATGYVYRAQAMQIQRHFAAKIVDTRRYGRPEFEEELLRRFRLEVEAMSRLRNPHVVAIYEAMQLHDNVFCLVMDFVDGRTLQQLLDRVGRIKLQRALDIIRQIANGLYEAHSLGFIHRDLKPDNIMIERLPASGFFARILDFGIVHMMDSVNSTQGFRGTPLYASPEQCMGDPGIDHRSDIYSLGCVFFHCLTGQPPFPGVESLKVMDAHVNQEPPTVSEILTNSRIPVGLDELLGRMLAKDPADRPEHLSEIIREIDALILRSTYEEATSPVTPGLVAGEVPRIGSTTESFVPDMEDQRIDTGDFPTATEGHESSAATSLVRPVVEFNLPDNIASEARAFTAYTLGFQGEFCAVADRMNRVHVIGLRNDGYLTTFHGARGLITALFIDHKARRVVASELDGSILIWNLDEADKAPMRVTKFDERIYALSSHPENPVVLCGTDRGRILSYDLRTKKTKVLVDSGPPISAFALSPTDNSIVAGFWGGPLKVISLHDGKSSDLPSLESNVSSIVLSNDGYICAVLDENSTIRVFSVVQRKNFFEIPAGVTKLKALAFDDASQLIGMGLDGMSIQLWDIRNDQLIRHLA